MVWIRKWICSRSSKNFDSELVCVLLLASKMWVVDLTGSEINFKFDSSLHKPRYRHNIIHCTQTLKKHQLSEVNFKQTRFSGPVMPFCVHNQLKWFPAILEMGAQFVHKHSITHTHEAQMANKRKSPDTYQDIVLSSVIVFKLNSVRIWKTMLIVIVFHFPARSFPAEQHHCSAQWRWKRFLARSLLWRRLTSVLTLVCSILQFIQFIKRRRRWVHSLHKHRLDLERCCASRCHECCAPCW